MPTKYVPVGSTALAKKNTKTIIIIIIIIKSLFNVGYIIYIDSLN